MKLHIIMHESFEGPGAIETWALSKGYSISYSRLYQGDELPKDTTGFDFFVVLGGPQSPATMLDECAYFDATAEINLIKQAVDANKLVLGICLGAQLIGEAFGAKFEHSPHKEIGIFRIKLTPAGLKDRIFSMFPVSFFVGHWHGDMPGLAEGSELLAYSEGCPRQIVRYNPRVYGFQCHFEFNKKAVEDMIAHSTNELEVCKDLPYVQTVSELRRNHYELINELLYQFLDELVRIVGFPS